MSITKSGFEYSVMYALSQIWTMTDANLYATAQLYGQMTGDPAQGSAYYHELKNRCDEQVPKIFEHLLKALIKNEPPGSGSASGELSDLSIEELLKRINE